MSTPSNHMHQFERGFTLVEVLVSLVIAMILLAGMVSVFVSQTNVANMMNGKTEAMGDLFLASQIMQSELRGAKTVCWDNSKKRIVYQPIDSAVVLSSSCTGPGNDNGSFELLTDKPVGPRICWDRPLDNSGCQELIRDIAVSKAVPGLDVLPKDNGDLRATRQVSLAAEYLDKEKKIADLELSFKIWPRN
ncbi:MAG: hypothetical protein CO186_00830 [Zetaproteobacteria bacterium CG_4_9_14_3_um_filter_49_83]|nr:MAG: hypothetical protein AUJ56_02165 [Zetaproteobacteria bacterium CG1_02_49_23]PIQ30009.1 MAG: hypothetical protein COW62_13405 [Zetaproteobacteria bacterium CG17_big_fil_post_rev_8_21_14_2_50_50_13]PIY56043.1 MAG: hypothetical protein COZ00_06870 [Zetaproteobacteria bacterium CG_4_10_14_0_8_um_filter_49_80]PJA36281.1 MAG: hypothetical protein CO186_00830 [Zetaproteobacteria bacterium CG_4_9_14_3_um_filter_49_83]